MKAYGLWAPFEHFLRLIPVETTPKIKIPFDPLSIILASRADQDWCIGELNNSFGKVFATVLFVRQGKNLRMVKPQLSVAAPWGFFLILLGT
jgi:hypothetical protein